ncbi:MAG TPA: Uma2 family endonuclease [Thermosynechococcus sp. M98_K2018_005]|nr:Uma2 family endonuclease [Thermosynechococcus sp. M98_K2018_005]HIK48984.1 Uma2 family endonuclease [Thermosynechococcus sp. M55_K2018_012]
MPIVPDFVAELRSPSDPIDHLRAKMQEYQRLGVRLGLLINCQDRHPTVPKRTWLFWTPPRSLIVAK